MNQIFKFKNFSWPGWMILLLLPIVIIYFNYAPRAFDYFNFLNQIENRYVLGIIFLVPLYVIYYIIDYPMQTFFKSKSYLEIRDGFLNMVVLSKIKWSIPVNSITMMDADQGQYSTKSDFFKILLSKRGVTIGFSFSAQNQTYEVKNFLENFENLKQTIVSLNPSIKFDSVTKKENKNFANQDLGKAIQEKAHGSPILTGVGKAVSKLNFISAFIIGLIITFALIIWLVIVTNPK